MFSILLTLSHATMQIYAFSYLNHRKKKALLGEALLGA